jgi:hypothetical protein
MGINFVSHSTPVQIHGWIDEGLVAGGAERKKGWCCLFQG